MSSHPTSKSRRRRQKIKRKYARLREDCQLSSIIETTPEWAVRNEVVDPARQGDQQFPELVRLALREGWATPEAAKPKIVADLLAAFFEEGQDPMLRVRLARLLLLLDQTQFERDRAEEVGKSGSSVMINLVTVDGAHGKDYAGEQAVQLPDGTPRPRLATSNVETGGGGFF